MRLSVESLTESSSEEVDNGGERRHTTTCGAGRPPKPENPMRRPSLQSLLVLVTLFMSCTDGSVVPMPGELLGVWRTTDPTYTDRFLEVTQTTVRFGNDAEEVGTLSVEEVRELESESGEPLYQIKYLSEEGYEYLLQLEHSTTSATLRLTNQSQMVWKRTSVYER